MTTCTVRMDDWANHHQPGHTMINGVPVQRFATTPVDAGQFHRVMQRANQGGYVSYADEQCFMQNSLQSEDLVAHLRAHADTYACVICAPYLFGTTFWSMQALPERALVVPCMHDEPTARFAIFREMLESAAGVLFNTQAEADFANTTLKLVNPYQAIVGYGFDPTPPHADAQAFRTQLGLAADTDILLYSGRLEVGKNVPLLLDYFQQYKDAHPSSLTLVLTGTGDIAIPERPDIIALGMLPEERLPDAFAAALALCQPSLNESFSIVLMEAWLQGRPVLVHSGCAVTSSHVQMSGGGLTFDTYACFHDALLTLQHDPHLATTLGQQGCAYVQQHYAWDVVIERLLTALATLSAPRNLYATLVQRGVQRSLAFTHRRFYDAFMRLMGQAQQDAGGMRADQLEQLQQSMHVALRNYRVESPLPLIGPLIAWGRRHVTAHLKEPYLDPMIDRQEHFNQLVLETMLPVLEQSLMTQRRLEREVAALRQQLEALKDGPLPPHPRPLSHKGSE
ncbi:MAG: glycosyltransferase family 4 protein [Chloroflexaceae bacterium]|nr:glycosyltransferase family 4 protein [Chloroflexaceae bacterium]